MGRALRQLWQSSRACVLRGGAVRQQQQQQQWWLVHSQVPSWLAPLSSSSSSSGTATPLRWLSRGLATSSQEGASVAPPVEQPRSEYQQQRQRAMAAAPPLDELLSSKEIDAIISSVIDPDTLGLELANEDPSKWSWADRDTFYECM